MNPGDHWSQRRRNLRISIIRPMIFALHRVSVNLSVKGLAYESRGSVELNDRLARRDVVHRESLSLKPGRHRLYVGVGGAELRAELRRGEPLVVIGRRFVLLLVDQLL